MADPSLVRTASSLEGGPNPQPRPLLQLLFDAAALGDDVVLASLLSWEGPEGEKLTGKEASALDDRYGLSPLHRAKTPEVARLLIEAGVDVNKRGYLGQTPLHTHCDDAAIMKVLLENGAEPDAVTSDGSTPLEWSVVADNLDCVKLLIAAGCDVNAANRNLNTPLHLVTSTRMTEYLLLHGAKVSSENALGQIPLETAAERKGEAEYSSIAELLLDVSTDRGLRHRPLKQVSTEDLLLSSKNPFVQQPSNVSAASVMARASSTQSRLSGRSTAASPSPTLPLARGEGEEEEEQPQQRPKSKWGIVRDTFLTRGKRSGLAESAVLQTSSSSSSLSEGETGGGKSRGEIGVGVVSTAWGGIEASTTPVNSTPQAPPAPRIRRESFGEWAPLNDVTASTRSASAVMADIAAILTGTTSSSSTRRLVSTVSPLQSSNGVEKRNSPTKEVLRQSSATSNVEVNAHRAGETAEEGDDDDDDVKNGGRSRVPAPPFQPAMPQTETFYHRFFCLCVKDRPFLALKMLDKQRTFLYAKGTSKIYSYDLSLLSPSAMRLIVDCDRRELVSHDVVQFVITAKWELYTLLRLKYEALLYFIFLSCFCFSSLYGHFFRSPLTNMADLLVITLGVRTVVRWMQEWRARGGTFYSVFRNDRFTGPLYVFLGAAYFLKFLRVLRWGTDDERDAGTGKVGTEDSHNELRLQETDITEALTAIAAVMAWVRVLYFCEPLSQDIGITMATVRRMISDVAVYAVVLVVFLTAFSHALSILFRHSGNEQFGNAKSSFVTLFFFIFNLDASAVVEEPRAWKRLMGIFLLATYQTLVVVIFLNLIVAVMTNSYEEIMENAKEEWLLQRAKFAVRMEDQTRARAKEEGNVFFDEGSLGRFVVVERSDGYNEVRLPREIIPAPDRLGLLHYVVGGEGGFLEIRARAGWERMRRLWRELRFLVTSGMRGVWRRDGFGRVSTTGGGGGGTRGSGEDARGEGRDDEKEAEIEDERTPFGASREFIKAGGADGNYGAISPSSRVGGENPSPRLGPFVFSTNSNSSLTFTASEPAHAATSSLATGASVLVGAYLRNQKYRHHKRAGSNFGGAWSGTGSGGAGVP